MFCYKAGLTFLTLCCMRDHFSRCLNSFLLRMSLKGNQFFWKILARNSGGLCHLSKAFPLWTVLNSYLHLSLRLQPHPEPKGFVFVLEGKKQPLTLLCDPWTTFVKPQSLRKLPAPVPIQHRMAYLNTWRGARQRGVFLMLCKARTKNLCKIKWRSSVVATWWESSHG